MAHSTSGTALTAYTYIIQPPGYWLFDRVAGLFSDPVLAITVMNILFSVAGIVVFYFTACFFTGRVNAFLAAFAYSTVFYIWFSGEIHSTYASQILFPVATFYVLLCYERDRATWMLWLAALIFAVGAGLRPSDGVFMMPMAMYFAAFRMPRKEAFLFLSLAFIFCLGWVIPTWLAYQHFQNVDSDVNGPHSVQKYVAHIATPFAGSVLANIRHCCAQRDPQPKGLARKGFGDLDRSRISVFSSHADYECALSEFPYRGDSLARCVRT